MDSGCLQKETTLTECRPQGKTDLFKIALRYLLSNILEKLQSISVYY